MFRKHKWIVWMSIFLSLPLLVLSSAQGAGQEETQRTVEEVHHSTATANYGAITQGAAALAAQPAVNEARWYEFWSHYQPPRKKIPKVSTSREVRTGSGRCGPGAYTAPDGSVHDLPPCWVMMRESRGNINAYNPSGCSGRGCFGKWQCDPRSCDGTGSEDAQDAQAAELWDDGNGCSHWAACG